MKWWFSDYDGTINKNHEGVDKQDKEFIKKWTDKKNKFIIASGRMKTEIQDIIEDNNFDCDFIISHNGAFLYDSNDKLISKLIIPMKIRQKLWEVIDKLKDKYTMGYCIKDDRRDISYIKTKQIDDNRLFIINRDDIDLEKAKKDILYDEELIIVYVFVNAEDSDDAKSYFKNIKGLKAVNSHPNTVEVMNDLVSKAHGITELQKIYNFKTDDVITSGDAENDLEMLKFTNNSFAMIKGQEKVKKVAKHIVESVCEIENILDI